jgi:ParB family chromosome partitioning protein
MTQSIILVAAGKLTKSPSNVRKSSDAQADAQLEASIVAHGILQNLIGLPVARKKGHYRITAGGRRLDAVHRAIEKGDLPSDFELPVMVVTDANDAVEISLSENFFVLAMSPADACRAFQDIIETEKKSPADIAKRFGLTERFVLGRLRLASLAEPVFEALRDGSITLDVAMAYASTSDVARQASVFEQLSSAYYRANVGEIRRQLASGGYRGSDPKALLVGREAYVEAGGRVDSDLFSDDATEMWIDGDLLDRLADEKLSAAAQAIREREGFAEIRAVAASHVPYTETYALRQVRGELPPLTQEQEKRCVQIQAELEAIEERAADEDGEGYTEEDEARLAALEAEYEAIQSRRPILTDEQKTSSLAYVVIGRDGQPRIHEQLYVAPASELDEEDHDGEDGEDGAVDAAVAAKPAISQRLADELAMMKTELLGLHVASDPRFALDLGTFYMVDAATRLYGAGELATELRANAPSPRVHGFESGTLAAEEWAKLDAALERGWIDHEDVCDRYDAFCALADEARAAWLGWAISRTIHAVPAGKTGSTFIDHLGRKLGIDVAAWWRPSARNYFDRITRPAILTLFETVGGAELRQRYSASKKHDLAASAEKLFAGQIIIEADVKERALAWLPDAMRFESVPEAGPAETDGPGIEPSEASPASHLSDVGPDASDDPSIATAA